MINNKLEEIKNNYQNYSTEDLNQALIDLYNDFNNTKKLIINLSYNLDEIEEVYNKIYYEVDNRTNGNETSN